MTPRILLDLDDVLVDWTGEAVKTFCLNVDESPKLKALLLENWGIDSIINEHAMWKHLASLGEDWWANLPELPWAQKLYAELSSLGEVCLLTSPSEHPSSAAGKVRWIKQHFNTRNYLIGKPKHFCANNQAILIDDRPENCKSFLEYGGYAYLWPRKYIFADHDKTGEREIATVSAFIRTIISGRQIDRYCRPMITPVDYV